MSSPPRRLTQRIVGLEAIAAPPVSENLQREKGGIVVGLAVECRSDKALGQRIAAGAGTQGFQSLAPCSSPGQRLRGRNQMGDLLQPSPSRERGWATFDFTRKGLSVLPAHGRRQRSFRQPAIWTGSSRSLQPRSRSS